MQCNIGNCFDLAPSFVWRRFMEGFLLPCVPRSCGEQLEVLGAEHARVAKTLEEKRGEMANRRYLKVKG